MRFRYKLVDDFENIWKIECDINDTIYDSIHKFYNVLSNKDKETFKHVLKCNLYHYKKLLPMKQPVKKLFNVNVIPIINTLHLNNK